MRRQRPIEQHLFGPLIRMNIRLLIAVAAFGAIVAMPSHAQNLAPPPPGCLKDLNGRVSCPPLGGEIYMKLSGEAVCGKGKCARDPFGKIVCSVVPGGQVQQDVSGTACAGGCEEASAANCQRLQ